MMRSNIRSNEELRRVCGIADAPKSVWNEEPAPIPFGSIAQFEIKPCTDESKLNKTEAAWLEVLRSRQPQWLCIQGITLKLGSDCRYTPDFATIEKGQFIFWECKGFQREDSLVKMKVAARKYSWAQLVKVERIKGDWVTTVIKP